MGVELMSNETEPREELDDILVYIKDIFSPYRFENVKKHSVDGDTIKIWYYD